MDEILDQLLKSSYQKYQDCQTNNMKSLESIKSIFDIFFAKCVEYRTEVKGNIYSFSDIRDQQCTKPKGDLFELFCARYLKSIKGYDQVWLLKELSETLKKQLKLPLGQKDYGIDLVCLKKGSYSAIQCKFKAPGQKRVVKNSYGELKTIYPCVNWKELSTFNELCNASGPWEKRITMTTAPSVRRLGGIKNPQDLSICFQSFQSLNAENWLKLNQKHNANSQVTPKISIQLKNPQAMIPSSHSDVDKVVPLSIEEVRAKRLLFFLGETPGEAQQKMTPL